MSGETSPLVRGNHNSCSRLLSSTSCEDEVITLNVGGLKFQTRRSTLRRYPETLLGTHFYIAFNLDTWDLKM